MMKRLLCLLLLGIAVTITAAAGPGSCVGRCGEVFARGQQCACDLNCLQHNECCQDFQAVCTSAQSCQGRCGETFSRGKTCECDPECIHYNTCCQDYHMRCDASVPVSRSFKSQPPRAKASGKKKAQMNGQTSNSESEEARPALSNTPVALLPSSRAPATAAPSSSRQTHNALSMGSSNPVRPFGTGYADTKKKAQIMPSLQGVPPSGPAEGLSGFASSKNSTLQDIAQSLGLFGVEKGTVAPGAGLPTSADLCSDSPIDGLTALSNGTILIFKGVLFWSVDPVSRLAGPPQSITDTLGIPSPIDTAFTRCNCHRNTYIIKGDQYWRLDENMVMEPGFPKPLTSEFPGVRGRISAALATPATSTRLETVYFFSDGDAMQMFTFPSSSTPPCSMTPRSSLKRRVARQAVLSGVINIKVSLKGLPVPVTSALSMLNPLRADRYELYILSGPLFFSIQISGDLPTLAKPDPSAALAPLLPILSPSVEVPTMTAQSAKPSLPANSIKVWLGCPL